MRSSSRSRCASVTRPISPTSSGGASATCSSDPTPRASGHAPAPLPARPSVGRPGLHRQRRTGCEPDPLRLTIQIVGGIKPKGRSSSLVAGSSSGSLPGCTAAHAAPARTSRPHWPMRPWSSAARSRSCSAASTNAGTATMTELFDRLGPAACRVPASTATGPPVRRSARAGSRRGRCAGRTPRSCAPAPQVGRLHRPAGQVGGVQTRAFQLQSEALVAQEPDEGGPLALEAPVGAGVVVGWTNMSHQPKWRAGRSSDMPGIIGDPAPGPQALFPALRRRRPGGPAPAGGHRGGQRPGGWWCG